MAHKLRLRSDSSSFAKKTLMEKGDGKSIAADDYPHCVEAV
jgi:hypothetical protein